MDLGRGVTRKKRHIKKLRNISKIGKNMGQNKKLSETLKKAYREGKIVSPFKKLWQNPEFRKKRIREMKENNPMKNPETRKKVGRKQKGKKKFKLSKVRKQLFKEGKLVPHNKGKGRQKILLCDNCKKFFKRFKRKIRKNAKNNFCSAKCKNEFFNKINFYGKIGAINRIPSKPELKFIEICKKHNLPYKYVGDGKFWIENINPDFVECNGKKIAIEIFSSYYHNPFHFTKLPYRKTFIGRKNILKKFGWKCLIFWDFEVNENFILKKLNKIR